MRVICVWSVFVLFVCLFPTLIWGQTDFIIEVDFANGVVVQPAPRGIPDWHAKQMVGLPNAPLAGDQVTAWAPATTNSQKAWAEVEFAKAISPAEIHIHECCSPGSVYQVSALIDGKETLIWKGADPTPKNAGRGVSKIPVDSKAKFKTVRIYLNCPVVDGWNEIDAVALLEAAKPGERDVPKLHWAVDAKASCTYSQADTIPFFDPFQTEEDRRAEQFALISAEIEQLKENVRSYEQVIDQQNAKIKKLYQKLDEQP